MAGRFGLLRGILCQAVCSTLGLAWGFALAGGHAAPWLCSIDFGLAGIASIVLMLLGAVLVRGSRSATLRVRLTCLAAVGYAFYLVVTEPFLVRDALDACVGILLLSPFLLVTGYLAPIGSWAGAAGAGLFLSTSLAMILRNGHDFWSGRGFFGGWIR